MPTRFEWQPWNRIEMSLNIVFGGIPFTGLAATTFFSIRRVIDQRYWNAAGTSWDVSPPASQPLVEQDATNFPGLYAGTIGEPYLDFNLGQKGYEAIAYETTSGLYETMRISAGPRKGGEWRETIADLFETTEENMGNLMVRLLSLRQSNMRFVPSAWNASSRQPTAGLVLIYDNAVDLQADSSPWPLAIGQYSVKGAFDAFGQLTSYTSAKDS